MHGRGPTALLMIAAAAATALTGCAERTVALGTDGGGGGADREDVTGEDAGARPDASPCTGAGDAGATSACLSPRQTPAYYVEEGNRYFDTLDADAGTDAGPAYSELVARWEWPPWLKLTAYGRDTIVSTDQRLKETSPTTVPVRDCRAFAVQPFGRCRVTFTYSGGPCGIYEEFTFNDQGEVTFVEAWSDLPGLLPTADAGDPWAEGPGVRRLSTKVPGLGNATGRIDLESAWMHKAERRDKDVADFAKRARDQWTYWAEELQAAGSDMYKRGCGW